MYRRKKNYIFILVLLIIIFLIIAVFSLTKYFLNYSSFSTLKFQNNSLLITLVLGIDKNSENKGRTDTIFLVFYNIKTHKLFIYTIPRDLRIKVNYEGKSFYDKINHIYYKSNIITLKKSLEKLLSINIPYYIILNYQIVQSLVDMLGGIKIYIDKDMHYIDHSGNLYIDIKKGFNLLDGDKIMEYLRFRADKDGDLGRIKRQINFINLLLQHKKELLKLSNIKKIVEIFYKELDTNYTLMDFNILINQFKNFPEENFYYEILLTKPIKIGGIDYLLPLQDGAYAKYRIKNIFKFLSSKEKKYTGKVTVEIKNGSNKKGMAKLLRNKLLYYDVNVLYYGNAKNIYKETVVIDRIGNLQKAQTIARILKTNNIYTKIDKGLGIDVTIIIGKDFNIDKVE